MPRRRKRHVLGLVLALFLIVGVCSSIASANAAVGHSGKVCPTVTTASSTKIPAGTVLRVGDQLDYLKTALKLSGEDQDFPYKVEYSAFVGGPPMLQAFQAGSIDAGFVGSTPLIFAQAAKQDITAVAGWATANGTYGLADFARQQGHLGLAMI